MAIGTGDTIVKKGTTKTLEASGASIANNAMAQADDASYSVSSDGSGAPSGRFVFSGAFGTSPTENTTLDIYARELNIDSTNDEQAPETTYKWKPITSLVVNNVTSTQYLKSPLVDDLPDEADYYLFNNATGQTLSGGWTLKLEPYTYGPAA